MLTHWARRGRGARGGIFNLVFRVLGATPRVWFAPSGSDGPRAAAGTAGRAHARVSPRGGRPRASGSPLAPPGPPGRARRRTKWLPAQEPPEPQGGKMAAAG